MTAVRYLLALAVASGVAFGLFFLMQFLISMEQHGDRATLTFVVPSRGLFGYRTEFLTDTRGEGILHHNFLEWDAWAGPLKGRTRGVLVADRPGKAVGFASGLDW